eukprot:TRINITY_DN12807_c1_g1_i1.p1 TRINITY_DN12807_c1_g1~~TRINITY_DN12807_c1_g1_i1.p1  ORF type:complete len:160 (+),score=50.52 TRINITY_DN12807_c1_g1_i1:65-481(+)
MGEKSAGRKAATSSSSSSNARQLRLLSFLAVGILGMLLLLSFPLFGMPADEGDPAEQEWGADAWQRADPRMATPGPSKEGSARYGALLPYLDRVIKTSGEEQLLATLQSAAESRSIESGEFDLFDLFVGDILHSDLLR